ncbi:helix-turn-helix domain-containing protein [Minwuia sp.]|uniref:helix-turn-helix domain-containing protein n=1 Tax=Minwuia sp. TaxID=2493630 RepID=UPI003A8F106D
METILARTPQQIGNHIRRCRKKQKMSQTQLSKITGIPQSTISEVESAQRASRLDTVLALLAALGLELRISDRTTGTEADLEDLF